MGRPRYPEQIILEALTRRRLGCRLQDLMQQYGFSEQTFYRWQARYDALDLQAAVCCGQPACDGSSARSLQYHRAAEAD